MLGANLAYLGGHQAGPFGNDPGRPTLSVFVRQRNRVMSRVGDNDVSTRYLGHHAPPRHGALLLSNAALDVRVALAFLMFLLHILKRPAHFLEVTEYLPWGIYLHDKKQVRHTQGTTKRHQAHPRSTGFVGRGVH